jgi:hypothetical protein
VGVLGLRVRGGNREQSEARDSIASIKQDIPDADVYLLIDGDGTLCAQETGEAMHSAFTFYHVCNTQIY